MALTLARSLHVARQVESQAPEVAQPEVLGLASLDTGALLLLSPQPPLIDVGWCVGVAGMSSGPAHCICRGESRRVVAGRPQQPRRESTVICSKTSSCDGLHSWLADEPRPTFPSNGLSPLPPTNPHPTYYSSSLSQPTGRSEKPET